MILDTLAAVISGSQLPPGKFAIQFARAYGGEKISTVAASTVVCGPIEAALANGMLAHSDETDDTHPPSQSHPGCSVVPAALAVGEKCGIDGQRFMRAVALGYDIGPRVTATLGKLQYMVATHRSTHAISGTFGSAAAAGCAAEPQRAADALAAVLHRAAGLRAGLVAARHRARREGVRLRRHAGEERRDGGAAGRGRRHRRGRHPLGRGQLLRGVRSQERSVDARGQARRALRDHAHQRQEMDRRRADPGAARRARDPAQEASASSRTR